MAAVPDALAAVLAIAEENMVDPSAAETKRWPFGVIGWVRAKEGSLKCVDDVEMDRQKGVLSHLIRSAGSKLLHGENILNTSLPVRIFEPRSVLQRISDHWGFAPLFLTRAAFAPDAVKRMQWVITFLVAGLHRGCTNRKPFNPILGETYQATYPDGTRIAMEQISHHPPVSMFEVVGPGEIFSVTGHHEFTASFRPNSLTGSQIGDTHVRFQDGTDIVFNMPYVLLKGTMWGERNFSWQGTVRFEDARNGIVGEIVFNPDEKGAIARFFSGSQKTPTDTIGGEIFVPRVSTDTWGRDVEERRVVSHISGSWLDGIQFDKKALWVAQTYAPFEPVPEPAESALPSDSQFREDLVHLREEKMEEAQQWKETLEKRQRRDRKLRKQHGSSSKGRRRSSIERQRAAAAAAAAAGEDDNEDVEESAEPRSKTPDSTVRSDKGAVSLQSDFIDISEKK